MRYMILESHFYQQMKNLVKLHLFSIMHHNLLLLCRNLNQKIF